MYKVFIGIDVSKGWIDAHMITFKDDQYLGRFDNKESGFKALYKKAVQTGGSKKDWLVCFEHTGNYSRLLGRWLYEKGIDYVEESALQIHNSMGITRGKNDRIDAQRIAEYVMEKRDKITLSVPASQAIETLKVLISRRKLLIRQRSALKVSVKERKSHLDAKMLAYLEEENGQLIGQINEQIDRVEAQMIKIVNADPRLKEVYELLRSITGVGPQIAVMMMAVTENFTRFVSSRKFASFCGIAPYAYTSGKIKGKARVSHLANHWVKSMLTMGARAAAMYDPELRLYKKRKMAEGKEYGCVINAVKNKLVSRMFAVVKRGTPYVEMATYA